MPRLPFIQRFCVRISTTRIALLLSGMLAIPATGVSGAPPVARIEAFSSTQGEAPFALHVHALTSSIYSGDETSARFEWTFGDPAGRFNDVVGWSASHMYDQPGTYTVVLRVIDQERAVHSSSLQVFVGASTRTSVYVSPAGSDNNSGATPGTAIRTLERAQQLMGDDKAFFLQRGAVFSGGGLSTGNRNVLISAYGSGAPPRIVYTSPTSYTRIIQVKSQAQDVVVENIHFDSIFEASNSIVRGIEARGSNVTVRNCIFEHVSDAINAGGGGVHGLFVQDNVAGAIGAYFAWLEGEHHTLIGNVVGGSVDEHNIRIGGASRILIAQNDLTNDNKSAIWCMLGEHAFITGNTFRKGRLVVGPNFAVVYSSDRFSGVVADANEFVDAQAILYDGAEHVTLRNNIMRSHGLEAISVWGYSDERGRGVVDVLIANNTIINNSANYGKAVKIGDGVAVAKIINNLYAAPWLNSHNGCNVMCEDSSLVGHVVSHNLWADPLVGSRWHVLWGSGFDAVEWNALAQTQNEMHRTFSAGDLAPNGLPQFDATVGIEVPGVMTDFYGHLRPIASDWHVGAVIAAPDSQSGPGDVDGNGVVNVSDVLQVIGSWGACTGCSADLNSDGQVNVVDLMAVISAW